jgi:SPP1 Gp6-like portal protein
MAAYDDNAFYYNDDLARDTAQEEKNRKDRLVRAWNAYRGVWPDLVQSQPGVNDNVKMNPARFIVNTGVHYLFGQPFTITGDFDNKNPPQWSKDIDKLLLVNKKMKFFQKLGINGGVTGHAFVKILKDGAGPRGDMPRWVVLDPGTVSVTTDQHDLDTVLCYTICYKYLKAPYPGSALMKTVIHEQAIEFQPNGTADHAGACWTIVDRERYEDEVAFVVLGREVWPFAWAPIVDCQNLVVPNDFWGLPDLEPDVLDICVQLQSIASHCAKIVRIYSSPRVVVEGMTSDMADEIDVSEENVITFPDPDAKMSVLSTNADLNAALSTHKLVYDALREMTQVPEVASGKSEHAMRASSGTQMAMMFAPLITKTSSKQLTYGDLIMELLRRSLVLMESILPNGASDPWDIFDMRIEWAEVMPGAAFLERQTLTVDQQLGASMDTLLSKLGYDPAVEKTNTIAWLKQIIKDLPELVDTTSLAKNMLPVPGPPMPPPKASGVNPGGSAGGVNSAGVAKTSDPGTAPPKP